MQFLAKITINKNLFNKVTSFWLRFVTKRGFDCEYVEQQTSRTRFSCSTFRNHSFTLHTDSVFCFYLLCCTMCSCAVFVVHSRHCVPSGSYGRSLIWWKCSFQQLVFFSTKRTMVHVLRRNNSMSSIF